MDVVVALVLGAIGSLIAAEVYANGPAIAGALIRRAVAQLPEHEQSRFLEEWLADGADFPGSDQKVLHAIGCCFGANAVAKALARPRKNEGSSEDKLENASAVKRTDFENASAVKQTDKETFGSSARFTRGRINLEAINLKLHGQLTELEKRLLKEVLSMRAHRVMLNASRIRMVRDKQSESNDF